MNFNGEVTLKFRDFGHYKKEIPDTIQKIEISFTIQKIEISDT